MADEINYQIPPVATGTARVLPWCLQAVAEGEAWLSTQRPAQSWAKVQTVLSGPDADDKVPGLSGVSYNKVKRTIRELVASLSNFRHEGEVKPRWDQTLYDQAAILTKLDENWYHSTKANEQHRAALQYGLGLGTGYLYQTWDKHFHGPYQGDIRLKAISPQNVTFVQLPEDHDIQRAYAVIIREELPINLARSMYGTTNAAFATALSPDRQSPGWIARGLQKVQQFISPALRAAGRMGAHQDQQGSFPTVDVFHMYTMDASINESGFPITMGAHGTNWSYVVPSLGDPIPLEQVNPATGQPFTRPATEEDCRLFPLRRLTIFSRTGVAYDGSSPWWHAQTPLTRIRFGDWAWEALGSSIAADIIPLQEGIIALMRLIEDSAAAKLDPAMIYDDQLVSSTFAKDFNPRMAGARAAGQINSGKIVDFPIDPRHFDVSPWITDWIAANESRMDYISGVTDMIAIAKAKQVPGADTLEKLMEMAGPIVQDMVRALEQPLQDLGTWRIAYYLQFYTRPRMLTVAGDDGHMLDIQFVPDKLIPAIRGESAEQRADRTRLLVSAFKYVITESGINEINRMTSRLFYLQLMKAGFPLSWWTMAEISRIPNFGPPPAGTNTELERYVAQQRILADLQIDLAQQMQMAGGAPPDPATGGGGTPGQPQPGGTGQTGPGRPNANTAPPQIKSKDGGARSTVVTSASS